MLSIRPAVHSDCSAMQALMELSTSTLFPMFYPVDVAESAARYLTLPDIDLIADGTSYVVEDEGLVAGCGAWSHRLKLFTGSSGQEHLSATLLDPSHDAARVRAFFVSPNQTRRGIGRMIYERCEQDARAAGFSRFELMATRPGFLLYQALGFERHEGSDVVFPDGVVMPCIRMTKQI